MPPRPTTRSATPPISLHPNLSGSTPDEYLLCFKQDRLTRIQASVRLDTAQAQEVFAAACAGWLQRGGRIGGTGRARARAVSRARS